MLQIYVGFHLGSLKGITSGFSFQGSKLAGNCVGNLDFLSSSARIIWFSYGWPKSRPCFFVVSPRMIQFKFNSLELFFHVDIFFWIFFWIFFGSFPEKWISCTKHKLEQLACICTNVFWGELLFFGEGFFFTTNRDDWITPIISHSIHGIGIFIYIYH